MSYLTACQSGWLAVFEDVKGRGYTTEPIACWLWTPSGVHPVCALGGDLCDATSADNYLGVVGPGGKPDTLYDAVRASRKEESASC